MGGNGGFSTDMAAFHCLGPEHGLWFIGNRCPSSHHHHPAVSISDSVIVTGYRYACVTRSLFWIYSWISVVVVAVLAWSLTTCLLHAGGNFHEREGGGGEGEGEREGGGRGGQ